MLSPIECRLYRDVLCEHLKRLALMGHLYIAAQIQQLLYLLTLFALQQDGKENERMMLRQPELYFTCAHEFNYL